MWAYCLIPNHVHLILTPRTPEGLGRALGKAHRRYSAFVNARMRVTGHLFQARFSSVVMDEDHLMAAARHVALNPVRAGLVARAEDWRWSSVSAHLAGRDDGLVEVAPLLERCGARFAALIAEEPDPAKIAAAQRRRDDRPPARRGSLPRPPRGADRARPAAGQTRAQEPRRGVAGRGGRAVSKHACFTVFTSAIRLLVLRL